MKGKSNQDIHLKSHLYFTFHLEEEGFKTLFDSFFEIKMTNNLIIDECKSSIFHPGYAVFYCKENDSTPNLDNVLITLKRTSYYQNLKRTISSDDYAISIKFRGVFINKMLIKNVSDTITISVNVSLKKSKTIFDNVLQIVSL
jgi:hypothetical protein